MLCMFLRGMFSGATLQLLVADVTQCHRRLGWVVQLCVLLLVCHLQLAGCRMVSGVVVCG
jgi:hypothetical protein